MTDDLIKYTGDPGSYFGYTTVPHTNAATTPWWVYFQPIEVHVIVAKGKHKDNFPMIIIAPTHSVDPQQQQNGEKTIISKITANL